MQSIQVSIPVGQYVQYPVFGSMVAYESGTSTTGNNYILIKGDDGNEMRLKPGQSAQMTKSSQYFFHCDDPTAQITARVIVGDGEFHDSAINATIAGSVIVTSGNITTVAGSHTITDAGSVTSATIANTDATAVPVRHQKLSTITNIASVTAGIAQVALSANAALQQLRIRNIGPGNISIGATGITMATGTIILGVNDIWIEEDAPGASWFVIADTANTTVNTQGLQ